MAIYNPLLTFRIFTQFGPAGIMSNTTKKTCTILQNKNLETHHNIKWIRLQQTYIGSLLVSIYFSHEKLLLNTSHCPISLRQLYVRLHTVLQFPTCWIKWISCASHTFVWSNTEIYTIPAKQATTSIIK